MSEPQDRPSYRLFTTTVDAIDTTRPSMVRVQVVGDCLQHFGRSGLDQRIKVLFPPYDEEAGVHLPMPDLGPEEFADDSGMVNLYRASCAMDTPPVWRTYTVRRIHPEGRWLQIDFVLHGTTSPSARWLNSLSVGDPVTIVGPDERSRRSRGGIEWKPGGASTILIAGDETALPAVAAIAESGTIPDGADVCIVVEAPEAADLDDVDADPTWTVHRVVRTDEESPGQAMERRVRDFLADRPEFLGDRGQHAPSVVAADGDEALWDTAEHVDDGGHYAWLAGEAGAVTRLRRHLVNELGVDKRAVSFMGYWKLGKAAAG